MYFTQPKGALFYVKSNPLDTEAKYVEDAIGTNDCSDIVEAEAKNNSNETTNSSLVG